jgi:hypothetical protein
MTSPHPHVDYDTSRTPSGHGTRPLLMVHQQLFDSMAIIHPHPFLHHLILFSRDWNMVFWRKKATLRALQYLH